MAEGKVTLVISDVEDIGNDQRRCTVRYLDAEGTVVKEIDSFHVSAVARIGIGPRVWALIQAGRFEGQIKPFVPPAE